MITLVTLALLVGALGLVAVVRARSAMAQARGVVGSFDASVRRLLVWAAVPGVAVGGWLCARGFHPPAAVLIGAVGAGGVLAVALALFRVEGLMGETDSRRLARQAAGQPPP